MVTGKWCIKEFKPEVLKLARDGGKVNAQQTGLKDFDAGPFLIKEEKTPEGKLKIILKDKETGKNSQIIQ